MPWTTLLGLDDLPGFLHGHGVVDAATARRIAYDECATWRRLLTDPASGQLLDYGRTNYTPPRNLADFVLARDQYCRFPTCDCCPPDRPNRRQHRLRWPRWSETTRGKCGEAAQLEPRTRPDDNSSIWTDPSGQQHRKPPAGLPNPDDDLGDPPF